MRYSVGLRSHAKATAASDAVVIVIDDDPQFLESTGRLLKSVGLGNLLYGSIAEFLDSELPDVPTCLALDVRLPGRSGLDLQSDLGASGVRVPIVFMTGHGDIPMSVQAMKAGAIEFLTKPFRDQDFLDAVNSGIARDRARREEDENLRQLRERFDVLTERERAILDRVVKGRLNKQIASELGITQTTVKVHRSNLMRKVKVSSLAELCRLADKLASQTRHGGEA